ncbi:hypothetical protein ACJJIG_08040 [Microbulbifer sp. SSSA007]|uniref:hypothetical protein n=1 Tax=Microbulbifer TaxID=48073 RepID=UPI00036CB62A|nr:hypothetical protein [Microbulbifer variabilis]
MIQRCLTVALIFMLTCTSVFAKEEINKKEKEKTRVDGWHAQSRLNASQWVGAWLISRDGEARHVWSLKPDGTGRSYAFLPNKKGKMQFAFGYDIHWYFDPFTQMANIKTGRRIICRRGKIYPYFLTLKSYESDYAVRGKFAWQTTWTEVSIGRNRLHKSLVVFVAPLSAWHDPERDAPCPEFPSLDLEKDIDSALKSWEREESPDLEVDTTPAQGEPEFEGEELKETAKKGVKKRKRN